MSGNVLIKENKVINNLYASQFKNIRISKTPVKKSKLNLSQINKSILILQEKINTYKSLSKQDPKSARKRDLIIKQFENDFIISNKIKPNKQSLSISTKVPFNNHKIGNNITNNCKTMNILNKSHNTDLKEKLPIATEENENLSIKNLFKEQIATKRSNTTMPQNLSINKVITKYINTTEKLSPTKKIFASSMDMNNTISLSYRGGLKKNKIELLNKTKNLKNETVRTINSSRNKKPKKIDLNNSLNITYKSDEHKNISYTSFITHRENTFLNKENDFSFISTSLQTSNIAQVFKKITQSFVITKTGVSGTDIQKINQDNYFIQKKFGIGHSIFYGICDGHGESGHLVSKYIINNLPHLLSTDIKKNSVKKRDLNLNKIIKDRFEALNNKLLLETTINTNFSGSTCVSLIYYPDRLICANIGDSRCILGRLVDNEWKFHCLSRDHKPSDKDEMERILKNNGKIEQFQDSNGDFLGPMRVWIKEGSVPGLAMSRSFGDKIASNIGVIASPEIIEWNFTKEDKFIVLASDGIWDFIDNQECIDIVKEFYAINEVTGACEFLQEEAARRWERENNVIDDITVIVIFLNN